MHIDACSAWKLVANYPSRTPARTSVPPIHRICLLPLMSAPCCSASASVPYGSMMVWCQMRRTFGRLTRNEFRNKSMTAGTGGLSYRIPVRNVEPAWTTCTPRFRTNLMRVDIRWRLKGNTDWISCRVCMASRSEKSPSRTPL